ncbi:hypothetical protein JOC94_002696 [Bacillus thermophilus]|uniref:Uncharacterized protein n=1 Tax=Siminovitchia thermophila TaxID=1245522 RepID=A0ABS2R7S9_9BACI|nr:hypothetical protein [Siminovitchia thermophila]MBM7715707.1 hypothetical protein [Siminovitchia thermophila]
MNKAGPIIHGDRLLQGNMQQMSCLIHTVIPPAHPTDMILLGTEVETRDRK